jgi:hypothetical protein
MINLDNPNTSKFSYNFYGRGEEVLKFKRKIKVLNEFEDDEQYLEIANEFEKITKEKE